MDSSKTPNDMLYSHEIELLDHSHLKESVFRYFVEQWHLLNDSESSTFSVQLARMDKAYGLLGQQHQYWMSRTQIGRLFGYTKNEIRWRMNMGKMILDNKVSSPVGRPGILSHDEEAQVISHVEGLTAARQCPTTSNS